MLRIEYGMWRKPGSIQVYNDGASMVGSVAVLEITRRPITIIASSTVNLDNYEISGNGLAEGQKIDSITTSSETDAGGNVINSVSDAVIVDKNGKDVTKNYLITYVTAQVQIYTVAYDGNGSDGGVVPTDDNTYKIGDTVTIPTDVPTKTGYTFKCWKVNPEYQPGDTFTFDTVHANAAAAGNVVTLTAQWTSNTPNAPKTGDGSPIGVYIALMALSLAAALAAGRKPNRIK